MIIVQLIQLALIDFYWMFRFILFHYFAEDFYTHPMGIIFGQVKGFVMNSIYNFNVENVIMRHNNNYT